MPGFSGVIRGDRCVYGAIAAQFRIAVIFAIYSIASRTHDDLLNFLKETIRDQHPDGFFKTEYLSGAECLGPVEVFTAAPLPSTMLGMNPLSTVYATKRRRRNGKSLKPPPKDGVTKSNPSKRHRERLNAELDTLANLLPFEQNILSKLDRLSILRLSVSYLRTKSYFQVTMLNSKEEAGQYRSRGELSMYEHIAIDGDMFLQALNGFLVILTCEGEVFFATHTIESYLGFHQSDIVHQSVYELVHSEDREELQRQLMWNSFLPPEQSGITLQEAIMPEHNHLLERSFTVRFRCLLDNTSGFLRLDIRGRVKILHGQNRKTEEPPLALFAICTPFGPPSLLEIPHKEVMFKSKHKLDLSLVSMDQRGKILLGYSDNELANMGGYDLVHYDDLAYVASAHQELLKTGASGMIAYRLQTKEGSWQWLQTSSRLVYKNSKPDFVICTHRPLMEEEGRDLLGKRTMDFKVSYLDAGLTNSYFSDSEQLSAASYSPSAQTTKSPSAPQRVNRRYKTQLRDFLSTCRTKRKISAAPVHVATSVAGTAVEYVAPADPTVAVYSNLNTVYPAAYGTPAADNTLSYMTGNFHQTLYDNRLPYLTTDNLFHQYRPPLANYYTEYPSSTYANGFLDIQSRTSPSSLPTYDTTSLMTDDKLYTCSQSIDPKYGTVVDNERTYKYMEPSYMMGPTCEMSPRSAARLKSMEPLTELNGLPKIEEVKTELYAEPRQTVLMWALNHTPQSSISGGRSPVDDVTTSPVSLNGLGTQWKKSYGCSDPLKSLAEMNSMSGAKWKPETPPSPKTYYQQLQYAPDAITEVWPTHHHYYPYHHTAAGSGMDGTGCGYPPINRMGVLCCPSRR